MSAYKKDEKVRLVFCKLFAWSQCFVGSSQKLSFIPRTKEQSCCLFVLNYDVWEELNISTLSRRVSKYREHVLLKYQEKTICFIQSLNAPPDLKHSFSGLISPDTPQTTCKLPPWLCWETWPTEASGLRQELINFPFLFLRKNPNIKLIKH